MEDKEVEKGLLTFYSYLRKLGEDKEFLEIIKDLKVVWDLLNKFFELHREKIIEIKKAIQLWHGESDRDIKESVEYIQRIPEINNELNLISGRILREIEEADKILYDKIIRREGIEETEQLKNYLKNFVNQIKENLEHLIYLYKRQNKYIKSKTVGEIEDDLKSYSFLYRLLYDESEADKKLKINIKNLILSIQSYLGRLEKEKQMIVSKLRIEEIHNPSSSDLKNFYENIMKVYFPDPSELDPIETYYDSIFNRYKKNYFGNYLFHVLILKSGTDVVGFWLMDFVGDEKKDYCLAIIWFTVIKEKYRMEGFRMFMQRARQLLLHDKEIGGYKSIVGAFFEVEDVDKVPKRLKLKCRKVIPIYKSSLLKRTEFTNDQISKILDKKPKNIATRWIKKIPVEMVDLFLKVRERAYRQLGCRKFDIKYEQPKLSEDGSPVKYLNLYLYPLNERYAKGINSEEFLVIYDLLYEGYCTYYTENGYPKEKDPTYNLMVKRIKENKFIKLV